MWIQTCCQCIKRKLATTIEFLACLKQLFFLQNQFYHPYSTLCSFSSKLILSRISKHAKVDILKAFFSSNNTLFVACFMLPLFYWIPGIFLWFRITCTQEKLYKAFLCTRVQNMGIFFSFFPYYSFSVYG